MNKVLAALKAMNNSPWTTIGSSFFVSVMCLLTAFRLFLSATPMWIGEVNIWLSGLLFGSAMMRLAMLAESKTARRQFGAEIAEEHW